MDRETELKIIEDTQALVAQMKADDIEDDPFTAEEMFTCDCCGEEKVIAGSVPYNSYILCNDCVLYAETAFALGKIKNANELIDMMEDKRLKDMCEFIIQEQINQNN